MRILHIVNAAETGGAQTLIEAMCRSRVPGDEHHVIVLLGPGALSKRLGAVADSIHHAGLRRRDVLPFRAITMVRKVVESKKIEIVHSHLLQSDLVTIFSGLAIPKLSTLHTSGAHESRQLAKLVGLAVAKLSGRLDAVVACSPSARAYGSSARYANAGMIPVIHNGTAVPPRYPAPEVPNAGRRVQLLQLARWHPMKDHRNLFQAVAILRARGINVHVDCAGVGMDPHNAELLALLEETGVAEAVRLHGAVDHVQDLFVRSSALVISSSHGEALPMAGLEALAAGLPVITTEVGDCAALAVDPELLVAPANPEALATAINSVASAGVQRWSELSRLAWERALASFEVGATARSYRHRYQFLITRAQRRACLPLFMWGRPARS